MRARGWVALASVAAACGSAGGRNVDPPAPPMQAPARASDARTAGGDEPFQLGLGLPVRTAHGVTWLWSKDFETDLRENKGRWFVERVKGSRREIVVTKGRDRMILTFDSDYGEGAVFGNVFAAQYGYQDGTIHIGLYPDAAPLSRDEAIAMAETLKGRKYSHGVAPGNGTFGVTFASPIDGGDDGTVVVGLYTRRIVSDSP
jgi:hypothetical protein